MTDHYLRPIDMGDLETVCRHRHEMFKASGRTDEALASMSGAFGEWLPPQLSSGRYFGWMAVAAQDAVVGGLGMMVIEWPPHPSHPTQAERGYILNVFTEPEHRGRGIARALMDRAMQEADRRNLDYMILHATQMARPMYEKMGWRQTAEMGFTLRRGTE